MSIQTEQSTTRIEYLTPKERLIKALRGERVDVYPVAPAYPSLFLADFERAFYAEQYRLRLRGRSSYPVQYEEDIQLRKQAFYQSYGIFKARPDWMEVHQGASRAWARRTEMVLQDGQVYYQDIDTGVRAAVKDIYLPAGDSRLTSQNASLQDLWDTSGQIESKEQIDELIPVVKAEEMLERGDFEYPRQVVADYGDEYFLSTVLDTPFSNAYDYLGFQGLMLFQHDHPDLLHYILERNLLQTEEMMKGWAASGIHGVYAEEVFTGADIISQRSYDEFVFPYNKTYFECMSKARLAANPLCVRQISSRAWSGFPGWRSRRWRRKKAKRISRSTWRRLSKVWTGGWRCSAISTPSSTVCMPRWMKWPGKSGARSVPARRRKVSWSAPAAHSRWTATRG